MLLNNQVSINIFKVDNTTFELIGEVNNFSSLMWCDKYNGYASFEIWAPITDENAKLFKKGYFVWCGGDTAGIIEIVKSEMDEDGNKTLNIKGRTLEAILTTRIIWGTYTATNKNVSTVMYEIVKNNCINNSQTNRNIPYLECAEDKFLGDKISLQKTGDEVYNAITDVASSADLGYNLLFKPQTKKIIFEVVEGVDRTVQATTAEGSEVVEFSTDLEDVLSSSYYSNNQDEKNVAFVQGEGEGADRVSMVSGDNKLIGFDRKELYVDARDLQSNGTDENGHPIELTPNQYKTVLWNRGNDKLSECITTETFEAQIRVLGDVQYNFNKDYFKGDKVTIRDNQLGVMISARITEVEEDFGEEYNLVLTFGYSYPTILQKIKRQL